MSVELHLTLRGVVLWTYAWPGVARHQVSQGTNASHQLVGPRATRGGLELPTLSEGSQLGPLWTCSSEETRRRLMSLKRPTCRRWALRRFPSGLENVPARRRVARNSKSGHKSTVADIVNEEQCDLLSPCTYQNILETNIIHM